MNYPQLKFEVIKNLLQNREGDLDLNLENQVYCDLLTNMKSSGLVSFSDFVVYENGIKEPISISVTEKGRLFFEGNTGPIKE